MKHVYKITPVSLYDVRGLESWLEDMARRGLVLKRLRPIRSTFERGPARNLRYRAEPCKRVMDDEPPQAMLDLYQDFGWDFVCDVNNELLIFATGDENAPEPHSDPELQGALWKKLYRSRRRIFFFELAVTLLLLFGTPYLLFREGMPVLTLLTTTAPILIVYLVFFLVTLPNYWADTQRLDRDIWWTEEDRSRVWTVKFYSREDAALLATASNGPGGFQIAAAASGNRAVLATYAGNGDLAEHLDEIVTMVK